MREVWVRRVSAFLAGGVAGVFAPNGIEIWLVGILGLLGVRLLVWQPPDFFGRLWRPEIIILGATVLVGYLYGLTGDLRLADPIRIEGVEVRGTLLDWQVSEGQGSGVFEIYAWSGGKVVNGGQEEAMPDDFAGQKYRLAVYPGADGALPVDWQQVVPGDALTFRANLERAPGAGTPGGFDRRIYDNVRGLSGTLTAKGNMTVLEMGTPSWVWRVRQHVSQYLATWSSEETGVLEGILFGDSSRIPPEIEENYRVTGVLHVFAASGSNVAFVAALFWGLFRFLPRTFRVTGTSLALLFYAALCGGNAPIIRATVLGVAALLGSLGQGRFSALRWLLFAAGGLFIINPLILKDIGFQLSFAATWGIIVLAPRLAALPIMSKVPAGLRQVMAVTWSAQLLTLPLLIDAFHRISLIGLVVNLFILFLLGTVLELGLVAVLLSFSVTLSAPLFQVCFWLLAWTNQILAYLATLPWADVWVLRPGWGFWLLWYGGIALYLVGLEKVLYMVKVQGLVWERKLAARLHRDQGCKRPERPERLGGSGGSAGATSAERFKEPAGDERFKEPEGAERFKEPAGAKMPEEPAGAERFREPARAEKSERPRGSAVSSKMDGAGYRPWRTEQIVKWGGILLIGLWLWAPWQGQGELEVTFIDVGQGDAILIRTPEEQTILIDAGPKTDNYDAGERIVIPYLLEMGVKELDALLVTHEHQDHIGGVGSILENIPTGWVGVPQVDERLTALEWRNTLSGYEQQAGQVQTLAVGDRVELDSQAWLEVLAPNEVLVGTHSDANNNSLVLKLHYAGQTVLLTGDMEAEEMKSMESAGADWEADFYKVPHHGSRYSLEKDLLDTMEPKAVFISVGKNSFGHPAEEIVDYWEQRRVPIYRTDLDGTIRLILDEDGAEIITGRPH